MSAGDPVYCSYEIKRARSYPSTTMLLAGSRKSSWKLCVGSVGLSVSFRCWAVLFPHNLHICFSDNNRRQDTNQSNQEWWLLHSQTGQLWRRWWFLDYQKHSLYYCILALFRLVILWIDVDRVLWWIRMWELEQVREVVLKVYSQSGYAVAGFWSVCCFRWQVLYSSLNRQGSRCHSVQGNFSATMRQHRAGLVDVSMWVQGAAWACRLSAMFRPPQAMPGGYHPAAPTTPRRCSAGYRVRRHHRTKRCLVLKIAAI